MSHAYTSPGHSRPCSISRAVSGSLVLLFMLTETFCAVNSLLRSSMHVSIRTVFVITRIDCAASITLDQNIFVDRKTAVRRCAHVLSGLQPGHRVHTASPYSSMQCKAQDSKYKLLNVSAEERLIIPSVINHGQRNDSLHTSTNILTPLPRAHL